MLFLLPYLQVIRGALPVAVIITVWDSCFEGKRFIVEGNYELLLVLLGLLPISNLLLNEIYLLFSRKKQAIMLKRHLK